MSDERKIGNEIINYSVNRGNPTCSNKNERELHKLGTESLLSNSNESGGIENPLSIPALSATTVERKGILFCKL